jgi:hypothetical protein
MITGEYLNKSSAPAFKEIVEHYGYATRSGVLSIVEGCLTTTDGQRVMNSCY